MDGSSGPASASPLEADYVVKGAGVTGLGFVDAMLGLTEATFIVVDRGAAPGGHWNQAYPFVTLHQPHDFYGLVSHAIDEHRLETHGSNAGLVSLPSGLRVTDYLHRAMRERFLPSGRVTYLPMSELDDDGEVISLLSGRRQRVQARRRVVDATRLAATIPLTHHRSFEVEGSLECVPPNMLPARAGSYRHFVVLGGGKTGLDSLSWLLDQGADPGSLTWVVPRDAWWSNRLASQAAPALRRDALALMVRQAEWVAQARSLDDLIGAMERSGSWLRLHDEVAPKMFHAATTSEREIERARSVGRVVRLGRVHRIEPGRITLDGGLLDVPAGTLFIDCTASALSARRADRTPVFSPGRIDLNYVRFPFLCLSVAVIACIEARVERDEDKRAMTTVAPMIDTPADWVNRVLINGANTGAWMAHQGVRQWLAGCRLDVFNRMFESVPTEDTEARRAIDRLQELAGPVREAMRRAHEGASAATDA